MSHEAEVKSGEAGEWKKYTEYSIAVDPDQDDRASEIKLCSFARPHMRAFHCSWWSFFIAFNIWFAVSPLLSEIRDDIGITKKDVWTANIIGVGSTILMRFVMGPLCDKLGPRILMGLVLCVAAVPTACVGFVNSAAGLTALRAAIGVAGASFVPNQFWCSRMFTKEVVGTANAISAGWGNLGGGATILIVGSVLFPLFKVFFDGDSEKAWRTCCIVPALVAFVTGITIIKISDDAPKGNYWEMKKHGAMIDISATSSFRQGAWNFNTWIMFFQYACSFGVELTMHSAFVLYFKDEFGQSTESAAAIASIFGWMNIFSRGLGGYVSDKMNARMGMRGRIWVQTICLLVEGGLVLWFAHSKDLAGAIIIMIIFSLFVQAACGTTFGIVPYIDPPATGSISGIVGAGGNCGAVGFGMGFRQLDYKEAFIIMGVGILISGLLSPFIYIKGYSAMFWGKDTVVEKAATLTVPEKGADETEEVNA